jgi:hypothetical protein
MDDDADLITVFGGTNDFNANSPIGTIADTASTTFYGSLHILIEGLIDKYPSKAIAFIASRQKSRVMINEKIIKFCNKP